MKLTYFVGCCLYMVTGSVTGIALANDVVQGTLALLISLTFLAEFETAFARIKKISTY